MSRVLIAGVGNVLRGDDGFGPEVARALAGAGGGADGVVVRDFGIRGYDLAFALLDPWDAVVLVDASARGGAPGTLYVIEPDEIDSHTPDPTQLVIATHAMHPARVLALVHAMGGRVERLRVLGCEPAPGHLGEDDDVVLGLSPPVAQAVAEAARLALELAGRLAEAAHA